jgi:hypothetical protein
MTSASSRKDPFDPNNPFNPLLIAVQVQRTAA